MHIYLLTFLVALSTTYFVTPIVRKFAFRVKALDHPDSRKVHAAPVPYLGGLAIYLGFLLAIVIAISFAKWGGIKIGIGNLLGILLGGTLLMGVGIVDDIRGMTPMVKLFFQTIAAAIVIYYGIEISFVSNPFDGIWMIGWFTIPLTLLWIVGVTNAMNLIDGLDGLASGVTAISCLALFFVALRTHQVGAAILVIALGGAVLGFIRYNFFPASIFLGDSGSMFLGFILATTSIIGVLKTTLVVALFVPVLILGVPIFDTLFAIGRRLKNGTHPFMADDKHIHHLLLRAGFTKREAVLCIYLACFVLSFFALIMALQK